VEASSYVNIQGCTILDAREEQKMPHAIEWSGAGNANVIGNCILGRGTGGALALAEGNGVKAGENMETD
jgi:hypothetical protein